MTTDTAFSLLNVAVLPWWALWLAAPRSELARRAASHGAIFVALACVYALLLAAALASNDVAGLRAGDVRAGLATPIGFLAGWTHYLAFDLFVGGWIVRDAQAQGVPHLAVVPALVGTFLAGPAGFLLYLAIRAVASARTRSAWRASSSSPNT